MLATRVVVAACALVGCAYEPSSFSFMTRPTGTRATIGCLDLAIAPRAAVSPERHPVLAYEFGNRCDSPVVVDLASMPVVGRAADGQSYALAPYDPHGEIREAVLDGRSYGSERIAYPSSVELIDVCVDAAAIARQTPAQWLCVMTDAVR
jgi:hypothetical protein